MATFEKFANVKVSCTNEDLGCPWKGLLKDLEEHSGPCEKKLFRSAIIDIHMLKARLEQKDREIHFLKNDFAIKLQNIAKQNVIKKKEKLVNIRNQTEKLGEILFAKVGEVQDENVMKNEEIDNLKKEVEELKKGKSELRSEITELKKETQKLGNEIIKISADVKSIKEKSNIKDEELGACAISTVPRPTELVKQVSQRSSLLPKRRQVFFDMTVKGMIKDNHIGRIVIDLFDDKAPKTCAKFVQFCTNENDVAYKGSKIIKISDDFCKMRCLSSSSYPKGYKTPQENLSGKVDEKGIVAMPIFIDGNTWSTFLITRKPDTRFDDKHVIIGKVTENTWCIMEEMFKQPTSDDNCPKKTISITDCGFI